MVVKPLEVFVLRFFYTLFPLCGWEDLSGGGVGVSVFTPRVLSVEDPSLLKGQGWGRVEVGPGLESGLGSRAEGVEVVGVGVIVGQGPG